MSKEDEKILFIEKLKQVKHNGFSTVLNDKLIILWASEIYDFTKKIKKR